MYGWWVWPWPINCLSFNSICPLRCMCPLRDRSSCFDARCYSSIRHRTRSTNSRTNWCVQTDLDIKIDLFIESYIGRPVGLCVMSCGGCVHVTKRPTGHIHTSNDDNRFTSSQMRSNQNRSHIVHCVSVGRAVHEIMCAMNTIYLYNILHFVCGAASDCPGRWQWRVVGRHHHSKYIYYIWMNSFDVICFD